MLLIVESATAPHTCSPISRCSKVNQPDQPIYSIKLIYINDIYLYLNN